MPSPDLARAARKIEDLPEKDDRAFDTLAGGVLRLLARVTQIETVNDRIMRRLAELERESEAADRVPGRNGAKTAFNGRGK